MALTSKMVDKMAATQVYHLTVIFVFSLEIKELSVTH